MKKGKILVLLLFMVLASSALMMACGSSNVLVNSLYNKKGEKVLCNVNMYYNGGIETGYYDAHLFFETGSRIPLPGIAGQSKLSNPTRKGYDFYDWYQLKTEYFDFRKEYLYAKDDDGLDILDKPTLDTKGNHAYKKIPFIKGHDFFTLSKGISPKSSKGAQTSCKTCGEGHDHFYATESQKEVTLRDIEYDEQLPKEEQKFLGTWNFDFDKVEEDIVLVAIWQARRQYVIVTPEYSNDNFNEEGYDKLEFFNIGASGDINTATLRSNASTLVTALKPGFKVKDYFLDRRFTKKVEFAGTKYYPEDDGNFEFIFNEATGRFNVFPIYIDLIESKYNLISSASNFRSIEENASYYIMNDLDFNGATLSVADVFRGTIQGNGYTWSNFSVYVDEQADRTTPYGGMFKSLRGAKITDVTFKNVNIVFRRLDEKLINAQFWSKYYTINMLFADMDAKTFISNVTLGVEGDNSTFSVQDYTSFIGISGDPVLDEVYGKEIRRSLQHGDRNGYVYYDPDLDAGLDIDGYNGYPAESDKDDESTWVVSANKGGSLLPFEYRRDYANRISVVREQAIGDNGKPLYGHVRYSAPPEAADRLLFNQFGEGFKYDDKGVLTNKISYPNNIIESKSSITIQEAAYNWIVEFNGERPKDLPAYKIPDDPTNYKFCGWFTEDFVNIKYISDLEVGTILTAYWNR